jgi:hypothetical protein
VGGLFVGLAQILDRQVVVGGIGPGRATLVGDYPDGAAVLRRLVQDLGNRQEAVAGIDVVTSPCVEPADPSFNPFSRSAAGITLDAANPVNVLKLIDLHASAGVLHQDWSTDPHGAIVALRIKPDTPVRTTYQALARATGVSVVSDERGDVSVRSSPSCRIALPESFRPSSSVGADPGCPRLQSLPFTARWPCEVLELHALGEIRFRGYVRVAHTTWALAETPDGHTWVAGFGTRVGLDFGRIEAIDEHGVTVRRIVRDTQGILSEEMSLIPF